MPQAALGRPRGPAPDTIAQKRLYQLMLDKGISATEIAAAGEVSADWVRKVAKKPDEPEPVPPLNDNQPAPTVRRNVNPVIVDMLLRDERLADHEPILTRVWIKAVDLFRRFSDGSKLDLGPRQDVPVSLLQRLANSLRLTVDAVTTHLRTCYAEGLLLELQPNVISLPLEFWTGSWQRQARTRLPAGGSGRTPAQQLTMLLVLAGGLAIPPVAGATKNTSLAHFPSRENKTEKIETADAEQLAALSPTGTENLPSLASFLPESVAAGARDAGATPAEAVAGDATKKPDTTKTPVDATKKPDATPAAGETAAATTPGAPTAEQTVPPAAPTAEQTVPPAAPPSVFARRGKIDVRWEVWHQGVQTMGALTGLGNRRSRALVGKLVREANNDCARVSQALATAVEERPVDPVAWLMKAVKPQQEIRNGFIAIQDREERERDANTIDGAVVAEDGSPAIGGKLVSLDDVPSAMLRMRARDAARKAGG